MSDIEDKVCRVIQSRADRGLVKYGVSMARSDLTRADWLRHARDEALDLAIYLQRLIYEESSGPDASGSKPRQPGQSGGGSSPSRLPAPQPEAELKRKCPVCGKDQIGTRMVSTDPGTVVYWHADGSGDHCAPQPERPSLADDPAAVERVEEAAGKAYSRMIHHAAEAVRMRAPDHLTTTRKAVAAAEWCENYARDLALTIRRDADALSAALRAAERKGGE